MEVSRFSLSELEDYLIPQVLKPMQILTTAIGFAPVMFLLIIVILFLNSEPGSGGYASRIVLILSLANIVVWLSIGMVSKFLFNKMMKTSFDDLQSFPPLRKKQLNEQSVLIEKFLGNTKNALIIRFALMEGSALIGLIAVLFAVLEGSIISNPVYWINLFSFLSFIFTLVRFYPSKEYFINTYNELLTDGF